MQSLRRDKAMGMPIQSYQEWHAGYSKALEAGWKSYLYRKKKNSLEPFYLDDNYREKILIIKQLESEEEKLIISLTLRKWLGNG